MSTLGAGAQTWVDQWLEPVRQRVIDRVSGMTRDRVFPSAWEIDDHLKYPPADRFVTLFVGRFPVDQTDVSGGGAINTAFDSVLTVTPFTRVEADIENWSEQSLTEATIGVYQFVHSVLTALQMWEGPENTAGTMLLFRRPMRVSPGFDVLKKSGKDGRRWVVAPMSFEVSFVSDLGVPYP